MSKVEYTWLVGWNIWPVLSKICECFVYTYTLWKLLVGLLRGNVNLFMKRYVYICCFII